MKKAFTLIRNKNHPRGFLSGVYNACCSRVLLNKQQNVEDPRQQHSGMVLLFNKGFTLIELLVVVLIIGILAAIALPQYQKAVIKTRYATLKPLVKALCDAEEVYYLANNAYTAKLADLDIPLPPTDTVIHDTATNNELGYDWGWCGIEVDKPNAMAHAYCKNTLGQIGYAKFFLHAPAYANKQVCVDYTGKATSPQSAVCKTESGLSSGQSAGTQLRYRW